MEFLTFDYSYFHTRQEQLDQRDLTIFQLKSTIEIVAHMSRQAHDLALNERHNYEKIIEDLNKKIQMYEIEIAKKYAILKWWFALSYCLKYGDYFEFSIF